MPHPATSGPTPKSSRVPGSGCAPTSDHAPTHALPRHPLIWSCTCAPVEGLARGDRRSAHAVPAGPQQQVPAFGVALQEQLRLQPAHLQEAPWGGAASLTGQAPFPRDPGRSAPAPPPNITPPRPHLLRTWTRLQAPRTASRGPTSSPRPRPRSRRPRSAPKSWFCLWRLSPVPSRPRPAPRHLHLSPNAKPALS